MFSFYNNRFETSRNSDRETRTYVVSDFDTLQKARRDLAGEIQAVVEYDEHIHMSNNKVAKETWGNIKSEELIHIGELMALIKQLDPSQEMYVKRGFDEFMSRHRNM